LDAVQRTLRGGADDVGAGLSADEALATRSHWKPLPGTRRQPRTLAKSTLKDSCVDNRYPLLVRRPLEGPIQARDRAANHEAHAYPARRMVNRAALERGDSLQPAASRELL
jgi:hypothetical protein